MASTDALRTLLASREIGGLATLKRDGRPQISTVLYGYDTATDVVRVSVTDDRAKTRNLERDPRASLYVTSADGWSWVVAEGTAELSPVAVSPQDATTEELVALYRSLRGDHPDWAEYRDVMVAERRRVIRLPIAHLYGMAGS